MSFAPIIVNTKDGFADITLPILGVKPGSEYNEVEVAGEFDGELVGFQISVRAAVPAGFVDGEVNQTAFQEQGIIVHSMGDPTFRFADMLSRLYTVVRYGSNVRKRIDLMSFALEEEVDFWNALTRFKVFHDPNEDRNEYFELYINFDLPGGSLQFHEKDSEYRQAIVNTFSSNGA